MVRSQRRPRVWRSKGGPSASPTNKSASEESSSVESAISSSATSQVSMDDRFLHIDSYPDTCSFLYFTGQSSNCPLFIAQGKATSQRCSMDWCSDARKVKWNHPIPCRSTPHHGWLQAKYPPRNGTCANGTACSNNISEARSQSWCRWRTTWCESKLLSSLALAPPPSNWHPSTVYWRRGERNPLHSLWAE